MHEVTWAIHKSLMHHGANQPSLADYAGDGSCDSHLLCSNANANHAWFALWRTRVLAGCNRLRSCLRLRSWHTCAGSINHALCQISVVIIISAPPATAARR
jgi:hypothetical protein